MKRTFIVITSVLLIYSYFRELHITKVLLMSAGLLLMYGVYVLPARTLAAMKYPLIIAGFLITALFFVFPRASLVYAARAAIVFVSLYGLAFYIAGMEENGKDFFKELTALSILFFSAAFNLFMAGELLLMVAFSSALLLLLFILDRMAMMPFIGGYTIVAVILAYFRGGSILGNGLSAIGRFDKYLLLTSSFALLVIGFIMFAKRQTFTKVLPFFGLLYIALDILFVLGLKLSTGLLYQPILFLALVSPLLGVMLKEEGGRI